MAARGLRVQASLTTRSREGDAEADDGVRRRDRQDSPLG
jgi:hypothetical protein